MSLNPPALPSKQGGSDSRLIPTGSEALARRWPDNPCMLACLQTGSVWLEPDVVSQNPKKIQAGFAQYDPGCLCKNPAKSESGKLVVGQLCSAKTEPDDSCMLACFRTRSVWPKPDKAIWVGSRPVLHNMIRAFFGRTEPNRTQEVRPAHMIWPDSGCTLALTAMVKMLPNWMWHVYRVFPLPLSLSAADVGGVEEVKLFDLLDDPGFQSLQVLKVGALDLTVVVKVDEGNVLLMRRRLVVILGRTDTAGEDRHSWGGQTQLGRTDTAGQTQLVRTDTAGEGR